MRTVLFLLSDELSIKEFSSFSKPEATEYYYASSEDQFRGFLKSKVFTVVVYFNFKLTLKESMLLSNDSMFIILFNDKVADLDFIETSDEQYFDGSDFARLVLFKKIRRLLEQNEKNTSSELFNVVFGSYATPVLVIRNIRKQGNKVAFYNESFLKTSRRALRLQIGNDFDVEGLYKKENIVTNHLHNNDETLFTVERTNEDTGLKEYSTVRIVKVKTKAADIDYTVVYEQKQIVNVMEEQSLRERVEFLSERMQNQTDFLASVAHDIRKPLNNIIGLVDLLQDSDLSEEQLFIANSMGQSSGNLRNLLNDLLDNSKLDSGIFEITNDFFELRSFADGLKSMFASEMNNKGLDFRINIDEKIPVFIRGDKNRLAQILVNLIANAIKFTPKGSVNVNVQLFAENNNEIILELSVIDTGIGIDEKHHDKIFEIYSQANVANDSAIGGKGLGLSICKKLAKLMSGEIWVESKLGIGSAFKIRLPFGVGQVEKAVKLNEDVKNLGGLNVLVIDDNETAGFVLNKILTSWNTKVIYKSSGTDALNACQEQNFDLVITDIQLPDINGLRLAKKIKDLAQKKGLVVPVIGISAYPYPKRHNGVEVLDNFLLKPINREELFKITEQTLIDYKSKINSIGMNYKIIDIEHVKAFTSNDPVFIRQLVDIFLKRTPEYMDELRNAIETKNWAQIKTMAHKVKPTFTYVGMSSFTDKVGSLEDYAINKDIDSIETILEEVWDDCQMAFDEFEDFVKTLDEH